ncbi:MAG TPA: NrfD/PsrC family molybdoenzyme membrane anchor subunit [Polyangiales bacterium]
MTSPSLAATIDRDMEASITRTTWRFWLALFVAAGFAALGGWAWSQILQVGFGLTGLDTPVMWGTLITNFVFFIGVSHAGTLVSAILFFARSPIRAGIGRSAEAMTVIAIMTAGLFPVIHLGRAWLCFWLLPYPNERQIWPNFHSPLVWDVFAITSYVTISALFLYMGLLPDLASLGRRLRGVRGWLYRSLSLGFSGTDGEWSLYEKAYPIFAGVVIPLAVSVHSVVSWDFAMSITPGWHSTIFAPYFVAGAIFSGVALAIILLAILRRAYNLHAYIRESHFDILARLMLAMSLIMTLVYVTEVFLSVFHGERAERDLYVWRMVGSQAPIFWSVIFCNSIAPLLCFSRRVRVDLRLLLVVAFLVSLGMWIERYMIVVTSLSHGYDPAQWGSYTPSRYELMITAGAFGWFTMLFMIFVKVFPSISISETKQAEHAQSSPDAGHAQSAEHAAIAIPTTAGESHA